MSNATEIANELERLCCAETEGAFFDYVTEAVGSIVRELRSASEWRLIETAPKDRNVIVTGRYANGRAYVEESCWHYRGHWTGRQFDPPTHWMPMPEPFGGWDSPAQQQIGR